MTEEYSHKSHRASYLTYQTPPCVMEFWWRYISRRFLPEEEEEANVNVLVRLNRAAAAARTLRRASANFTTVAKAMRQVARLQRALGPGSFLHDLVVLANPKAADARRMAAARRLARHYVTRGAIFHANRWSSLESEFNERRDGRDFKAAWVELAAPAILLAFEAIPGDTPLAEVWRELRRRVRAEIERDLLGRTLDSRTQDSIVGDAEPAALQELMHAVDLRLDDLVALQVLEPAERDLLIAYKSVDSAGHIALARRLGISNGTLRQRASRSLQKVKQFHR